MKGTSPAPVSRVRLLLGSFVAIACLASNAEAQDVNARATQCPTDATVKGYTSIAAINQDQFDEATRIGAGTSKPSPPYSFVLCPSTQFDTSKEPLDILLSGSIFSCGSDTRASSSMGCTFVGGMTQVSVADSTTLNYELFSTTMIGVTFEQFNGTAIDVKATETLTLTLMDVVWKNFFSDFIIRQQRKVDGTFPARVEVIGGVVENGIGGSLFSNDGGVLTLEKLSVGKTTAAGLVSTSNGGVTMISSSTISKSTLDTVASATMGSILSIMDVQVFDMVFTNTIFQAENAGSKLLLNRTVVRDINHLTPWKGVLVDDSAEAVLEQVVFDKNYKFESLVHAQASASVQMIHCLFDGNVGRGPSGVSNAVYALLGATINIRRTKFSDNTNQTALVFAAMQSAVAMEQSCIMGGTTEEVVFVSSDSSFAHLENNLAKNVASTTCPSGEGRLSVEQVGSTCYQETSTSCRKSCGILADQASCMADVTMFAARQTPVNGTNTTVPPNMTMVPAGPGNTTVAPTLGGNQTVQPTTIAPTPTENATDAPIGNETAAPTEIETPTTRIIVSFVVRNDMMIASSEEVNASGLGVAFPVYVEQLVANQSTTARRQLLQQQRRRLEVALVPNSAEIYEIFRTGCVFENRTTNMTTSDFSTCHQAMGRYDLLLSADEDPAAVMATYTQQTRNGIDDGTFQDVLLQVEPTSPLLVGPSLDLPETVAPTPTTGTVQPSGPPVMLYPTCAPVAKGSSNSRSKGKGGMSKGGMKGMKMMKRGRHHSKGKGSRRRNLDGHGIGGDSEAVDGPNFENALKQHDEGYYYSTNEHEEEEEIHDEDYEAAEVEDMDPPECVEPEDGYRGSQSKGKSSKSRRLREELPRVHGAHHHTHHIGDLRRTLAAELAEADATLVADKAKQDIKESLPWDPVR